MPINPLSQITRHLMIYSMSLDNIGLMTGKMGIALFFYRLHRVTKNKTHLAFANQLVEDIIPQISYKIPRTFFEGLVGLSWGFDYLTRNNFVAFNDENILLELDRALLEINIPYLLDETFSTGIRGIAYYITSRCCGKEQIPAPFCNEYIHAIYKRMNRIEQKDPLCISLMSKLQHIVNGNIIAYDLNPFFFLIGDEPFDNSTLFIPNRNIGIIDNGYTGIALRLLKDMK